MRCCSVLLNGFVKALSRVLLVIFAFTVYGVVRNKRRARMVLQRCFV
jgi:hypothetical protein